MKSIETSTDSTIESKIETIIVDSKITKAFFRDRFTKRRFDNVVNVIMNMFNDAFFHFSFFENIIL